MDTMTLIAFFCLGALSLASVILSVVLLMKNGKKSNDDIKDELSRLRREQVGQLTDLQSHLHEDLQAGTRTTNEMQFKQMAQINDSVSQSIKNLNETVEKRLDTVNATMEQKMKSMQESNEKKLDEMRGVVDEKLQKTLNDRMTQSFNAVNERLENVYKELGEIQNLSTGVGNLNKILSNVKTRGIFGEVQLERILEQVLTRDQYDSNVVTKHGSSDPVEFAVRLPSKDSDESFLYLPIDAKFPLDRYTALLDAYDTGDADVIEKASKAFETFIKENAKKIQTKYIDPPHTTTFALMFLPTEGLYAEVVKRPALFETIQRDYGVTVTGPSTVTAFLNSLQMGFRTLAIEKRSNEVWQLLGAVKTEFTKFSDVLENVRKRLNSADSDLDALIGKRTRSIMRNLKTVQELPSDAAAKMLGEEESNEATPAEGEEE